ncbi:MAG: acyltransferase [Patulibacter sp.]
MSPSPAVTPPPGQPRFAGLDALRAFAVIAVVICHASGVAGVWRTTSWGWIGEAAQAGVVVFFVLSGFLVYRPFVAAHAAGERGPTVGRYARRRLLRIVPAYWVALTVLSLFPGTAGTFSDDWWKYYFLLNGYETSAVGGGIGIAWSLGAEVAFYLLLPFLAVLATRCARRWAPDRWWRGELVVVVAFGLFSPVVLLGVNAAIVGSTGDPLIPISLYPTILGVTDWFAAGMLLAVVSVAAAERPGRARRLTERVARHGPLLWALAVLAWLFGARAPWLFGAHLSMPLVVHLSYTVASLLVVAPVVCGAGGIVGRVTRWRGLALLGLISYGVYLWHYVIAWWLGGGGDPAFAAGPGLADRPHALVTVTVATFALSIAIAALSYRVVELPFLRRKEGPRHDPAASVSAGDGSGPTPTRSA